MCGANAGGCESMKRYGATVALLLLTVVFGLYFVVVENPRERVKDEQRERESRVIDLKEDEKIGRAHV